MRLVNQDGEGLVLQIGKQLVVENVIKFMDGRNDNLGVTTQSNRQIVGIAPIVQDLDLSAFMLYAHDGFLQLTVNNDTVGDNQNSIKHIFVISIMYRG